MSIETPPENFPKQQPFAIYSEPGRGEKAVLCENPDLRAPSRMARWATVSTKRRKQKSPTCDDCFFRCNRLCALNLDEPCSTFRPNRPEGLVPLRQPVLLVRDPGQGAGADLDDGLAQTA
jgi:hypothetical protein